MQGTPGRHLMPLRPKRAGVRCGGWILAHSPFTSMLLSVFLPNQILDQAPESLCDPDRLIQRRIAVRPALHAGVVG